MSLQEQVITKSRDSILSANKVLRNTYLLLSLTLVFSAVTAYFAMITNAAPMNIFVLLIGYFGLLFVTTRLRNSTWGLLAIFAFTGFLGYTLGPILNLYIKSFSNGTQLVMTSLGATGVIFFSLSAYALTTKKDFSYLAAFLFVGIAAAFIMGLVAIVFSLPMLSLLVSCAFVLLSSGIILFQTSLIINGGERNYIMATITLYVALFNLFISLLNILSAFGGRR
ncbi:MAG: Bax inhibitor-1/YccA family protein [Gammaproteobacteria bacterium]|jgi:modulator of FtsH protease